MPRFHLLLLTGRAQLQIPTRQSFNGQLKHLLEFAAFNLTSLIKFSENEHLKWGQNRTTEMDGKFHTFTCSPALKVLEFVIKSNFLYEESLK